MIPGFTPVESAVAACVIDDLSSRDAAAALGMSRRQVQHRTLRLRRRFGERSLAGLRVALFDCERVDLRALDASEFGPLADAAVKPLGRPLTTGEPL